MKRIATILILLTLAFAAFAQRNHTVSGVVTDSLNHENLFYVRVGIVTPDSARSVIGSAFSDDKGKFSVTDIPDGNYLLVCSLVGYDVLTTPIEVGGTEKVVNLGNVFMKKRSAALGEVTIAAEKPVYLIDGEKTMYNVSEDPTIQSGTAADALQNAPGVEVDVEGNVTVRGTSSVEIWLNGKPSNMNEDALKDFLQQMPASNIERIEVITNPSARYSARGSGGVINVVTTSAIKKNSFLSFGVRGSTSPDVIPWISYVYGTDKLSLSFYVNYHFSSGRNDNEGGSVRFTDEGDTASVTFSKSTWRGPRHGEGFYFNGSYVIDTMTSIYFWAGGWGGQSRYSSLARYNRYEMIYAPGNYSYGDTSFIHGLDGGGYGGLWLTHDFNKQGHRIEFSINGNTYCHGGGSEERMLYDEMVFKNKFMQTKSKSGDFGLSASLDYTIPYHKNGEIALGVSGDYGREWSTEEMDTLQRGISEFVRDYMRSCQSIDQNAGFDSYVTIQHKFGNFTIKGGLRSEYLFLHGDVFNSHADTVLRKHYWGLFPSIHLSYRTKKMDNFKLSYTRRVNNPSIRQLSPFVYYSEESFSTGNPDLLQAFTHSVEAGWTRFIRKFGNVGVNAYFRYSKDQFNSFSDVIFSDYYGRIVSYSMPINAGRTLNTGADLNVTYQLKAFMSLRFYANLYYMKEKFEMPADLHVGTDNRSFEVSNLGYSFRLNFWAKLWKMLEVNLSANYASKSKSLFTITQPRYSIDAGLRADFLKRKISVHLNVNDIFNWNKFGSETTNPFYQSTSMGRYAWNRRSIRAGITFRFGKMELESKASQGQQQGQGVQGM